jgi:hypothetical protein
MPVVFIALAASYILGLILDSVARQWYRLFKKADAREASLERLRQTYPELEIESRTTDWSMLRAFYWLRDKEFVTYLERLNVTRIMLRNFSLGFAFLSIIQIIVYIPNWRQIEQLLLGVVSLGAVLLTGYQSAKFGAWFHEGYYQAIVANTLEASDWVKRRSD